MYVTPITYVHILKRARLINPVNLTHFQETKRRKKKPPLIKQFIPSSINQPSLFYFILNLNRIIHLLHLQILPLQAGKPYNRIKCPIPLPHAFEHLPSPIRQPQLQFAQPSLLPDEFRHARVGVRFLHFG